MPHPQAELFPPGLANAYRFATFNALSYQMILGSPVVLYAKYLGASATVLGIIAGMMPLLLIFQIPAANHVERIGYRRFVYAGWWTRVALIFAMALVPWMGGFLDPVTQLALLMFLLFGFNLARGISSAAWLPWITALVPVGVRGTFLAREALCVHVASCLTLSLAALCLGTRPRPWQFSAIFAFSAAMGAISLSFLKRIPDVTPPSGPSGAKGPVPWRALAGHPPFRKLLRMATAWSIAYGGLGPFTVAYLKAEAGLSQGAILLLIGLSFLGGLAGLVYFGSRTDRLGSKPVVMFCLCLWNGLMLAWLAFAGGAARPTFGLVLFVELLMGFAAALVNMNLTRLAMLLVPAMGRSHFFALYSVVTNLALGLAPVGWGLLIDAFGERRVRWHQFELDRYGVFFGAALVVFALALVLCQKLDEPKARDMDELLREILQTPQKLWLRLFPRG